MTYKQKFIPSMLIACTATCISPSGYAALANNATLNFNQGLAACYYDSPCSPVYGSYYGFDTSVNGTITDNEKVLMRQHDGLILGTTQTSSLGHSGPITFNESPGIDEPTTFFGNTAMHFTVSPPNVLASSGNTAIIDFSGWSFTWNGVPEISLGSGAWQAGFKDGEAQVVCGVDCGDQDTFTLDYSATLPESNMYVMGGVYYTLHLEGTVSVVPVPAAVWLFVSGLMGLLSFARCRPK